MNSFIKKNYANPTNPQPILHSLISPENQKLQATIDSLKGLSLNDETTQQRIRALLFTSLKEAPERGQDIIEFMGKAHFPIQFAQDPKSKAKWQVHWRPDIADKVRLAYRVFPGALSPAHKLYSPKLRTLLQMFEQCLVC